MYKVIRFFTDMKDFNHPYKVGDTYPREGMTVSEKRLSELSGSLNRQRKPLIELVPEPITKAPVLETQKEESVAETPKYKKSDINRMPKAELQSLAISLHIDNADQMSGAELKTEIIKTLSL